MKKVIRKVVKYTIRTLGVILLLLVIVIGGVFLYLRSETGGAWLTGKISSFLTEQIGSKVKIGKIDFELPKGVVLHHVYIEDYKHNPIISFSEGQVYGFRYNLVNNNITFGDVILDSLKFDLVHYKKAPYSNLEFIIAKFDSKDTVPKPKTAGGDLFFNHVQLRNSFFRFDNEDKEFGKIGSIDWDHVLAKDINLEMADVKISDNIIGRILQLQLREQSGFTLRNMQSRVLYSDTAIILNNLLLKTPQSILQDHLALRYKNIDAMSSFIDSVKMEGNFINSVFNLKDLEYFAHGALKNKVDSVIINKGKVSGTVANLKLNDADLIYGNFSRIEGSVSFKGLPNIDETFINARIKEAFTSRDELMRLIPESILPLELNKFGKVRFKGKYIGFINDFVTEGDIFTELGNATTDLRLAMGKYESQNIYSGNLKLDNFDIGKLINNKQVGKVSLKAAMIGSGFTLDSLNAKINANVYAAYFNGYNYNNVKVEGNFLKKYFEGTLISKDKNANLAFKGKVDLNNTTKYIGTLDIANIDFRALNFLKDTLQVTTKLIFNVSGNNLDNIQGNIKAYSTALIAPNKLYAFDTLRINSLILPSERRLIIQSEFLEASLTGKFTPSRLQDFAKTLADKYISSDFLVIKGKTVSDEYIDLEVKYDQIDPLLKMLKVPISLNDSGQVSGHFDTRDGKIDLKGNIPGAGYEKIKVENLVFNANSQGNNLDFNFSTGRVLQADSAIVKYSDFKSFYDKKNLTFQLRTADKDSINRLSLNGTLSIVGEKAKLTFDSSIVDINNFIWNLNSKPIEFYKIDSLIDFPLITFTNQGQNLKVIGKYRGKGQDEPIRVLVEDINIKKISPFIPSLRDFNGDINGSVLITRIKNKPIIEASLFISPLVYINDTMGIITAITSLDQATNKLSIETTLSDYNTNEEVLNGKGNINTSNQELKFSVDLNKTPLGILAPFTTGLASNLKGFATAKINIEGNTSSPDIAGKIKLNDASFKFDYLGTTYHTTHEILFSKKKLFLNDLVLKDINENSAIVSGTVDLAHPSDPLLNIQMRPNDFQLLNTKQSDNELYFGTAYGSGLVKIFGTPNDLDLFIKIKSDKGTIFNLPIGGAASYNGHEYITFVDIHKKREEKESGKMSGLSMRFELAITPEAQMNIIFDPLVGDVMEGRGSGDIQMNIDTRGDFNMTGLYTISQGSYRFTVYDLLTKQFNITPGGTVAFRGNPLEAEMNVQATFKTRTSVGPLLEGLTTDNSANNRIVPVTALLNLKGQLLQPDIKMDFDLPQENKISTSGSDLDSRIRQIKADDQELQKQVVSLLVFGGFSPAFQGIGGGDAVGSGINGSIGSLVSRQIGYFLSQISDNVQLGVDFKKGEGTTFNGSLNLFNDKVEIVGNYDANVSRAATYNAQASLKLKQDGSFRAKAHSRSNNNPTIQNENTNTIGVGLSYQQEFDRLNIFHPGRWFKKNGK